MQGVLAERLEDLESQSGLADGQEVSGVPEGDVGQAPALHLLATWATLMSDRVLLVTSYHPPTTYHPIRLWPPRL